MVKVGECVYELWVLCWVVVHYDLRSRVIVALQWTERFMNHEHCAGWLLTRGLW
jgi:hypothetical protein